MLSEKENASVAPARIDSLVRDAVFGADDRVREEGRQAIRRLASVRGIFPASIQGLYRAAGRGQYQGITVPAINIRGITYHVARAVFRAALKGKAGAFIFELARSEMGYTGQRPAEYAACVLAAAIREGFQGPVFLQGDHFQVRRSKYSAEPEQELGAIRELIREAAGAGFFNIDIDASTLVDLEQPGRDKQQKDNYLITAQMTEFIRQVEPEGVTISVGGEIGEVGKRNSTMAELRAFMKGYLRRLEPQVAGISKISVQTGTRHGGVVLPDGKIASVDLDFKTLEALSRVAREEYGLSGAVQHGASTLPDEAFHLFPQTGTAEVHLATGFQNLLYDSPYFPGKLLKKIYDRLLESYVSEWKAGETQEQFLYKTRKKAFGDFKEEMWGIAEDNLAGIRGELEERFGFLFGKLNVTGTVELVNRFITPGQRPA